MTEETNKKAKELVEKYYNAMNPHQPDCSISWRQAKQCALIACDGIIDYIYSKSNGYYTFTGEVRADYDEQLAIKQAIENL